jgi:hypothetical protein
LATKKSNISAPLQPFFQVAVRERWNGIGRLTVRGTGGGKVGKFKYLLDALEFRRRILAQIDRVKT